MTSPLTPDQWKLLDPKLSGDAFQKEAARQQRRWLSYLYYSLRLALLPPEPSVTISIRSKSKRNRAIAEFEPSLLSRISDFILKRMDEEFKGNPTYERMMEERMLKKG